MGTLACLGHVVGALRWSRLLGVKQRRAVQAQAAVIGGRQRSVLIPVFASRRDSARASAMSPAAAA
jgi:hypothetical protein